MGMEQVQALLKKGNRQFDEHSIYENATIVLGTNSNQRNAFVRYLTGAIDEKEYLHEYSGKSTREFIFPQLYFANASSIAIYNCPGYYDDRTIAEDVAASYFTGKVLNGILYMKLLLVIDYKVLTEAPHNEEFQRMAEQITKMITKAEEFKDSTALIITGIDGQDVVEKLPAILEKLKSQLRALEKYKGFVPFLNAIQLGKRIEFFGSPSYEKKQLITKMIETSIDFTETKTTSFAYAFPEGSLSKLNHLANQVKFVIVNSLQDIEESLIKFYYEEEQVSGDLNELREIFEKALDDFLKVQNSSGYQEFIEAMKSVTRSCITMPWKIDKKLNDNVGYLTLFDMLEGGSLSSDNFWKQGLTKIVQYLESSHFWYDTLDDLFQVSLQRTVRERLKRNESFISEARDQCNTEGGVDLSHTSIPEFIKFVLNKPKEQYHFVVNNRKLIMLGKVMDVILDTFVEKYYNPEDNSCNVRGSYVLFNEEDYMVREDTECDKLLIFATMGIPEEIHIPLSLPLFVRDVYIFTGDMVDHRIVYNGNTIGNETSLGILEIKTLDENIVINQLDNIQGDSIYGFINIFKWFYILYLSKSFLPNADNSYLHELNYDSRITQHANVQDLETEFIYLENLYFLLHKDPNLLTHYQILLDKTREYARNPTEHETSLEHKKVLSYLYISILSKICIIRTDNNLVIDLEEVVSLALHNTNEIEKAIIEENFIVLSNKHQEMIRNENQKYKHSINSSINEARYLFRKHIIPEIDPIMEGINRLLDEISELQKKRVMRIELEKKKKQLEDHIVWMSFLETVRSVATNFDALLEVSSLITNAIDDGINGVEDWFLGEKPNPDQIELLKLPEGVLNSIHSAIDQIYSDKHTAINQLSDILNALKIHLHEQPNESFDEIINEVEALKEDIQNQPYGGYDDKGQYEIKRKALIKNLREKSISVYKGRNKWIELALFTSITLFRIGKSMYNSVRENKEKLLPFAEAIEAMDEKLEQAEQFKQNVRVLMVAASEDLNNIAIEMKREIHVSLDIRNWQVRTYIKELKEHFFAMTHGFKTPGRLLDLTDNLQSAMSVMISVYDRIQIYYDQSKLASYLAAINSIASTDVEVNNEVIDRLKLIFRNNIIIAQYQKAMNAYKQYAFPFAEVYLQEFSLPETLFVTYKNNTQELVETTERNLKQMLANLKESQISIDGYDKYIRRDTEFKSNNLLGPFFSWSNQTYNHAISKLLSGERITLKAQIARGIQYNSIKFRTVNLRFKVKNPALQKELENHLLNFQVSLTHIGDSHYRCCDKFYIIWSEPQTLNYTMQTKSDGDPLSSNKVYNKLKDGNLLLSPYATWNIKLINPTGNYEVLKKYKGQVDLELEGTGQYIPQKYFNSKVCYNLENYYSQDDINPDLEFYGLFDDTDTDNEADAEEVDISKIDNSRKIASSASSMHKNTLFHKALDLLVFGASVLQNLAGLANTNEWVGKNEGLEFLPSVMPPSWTASQKMYEELEDGETPVGGCKVSQYMNCESNLLLYDTLIRKVTGVTHGRVGGSTSRGIDEQKQREYGSNLAYRYYQPK